MTGVGDTFIRLDKRTGECTTVSRADLLGPVGATAERLDGATEAAPVQTPVASYWPTMAVVTERTAGQAIAHAMSRFIHDEIGQSGLAMAIDDALRTYR